MVHSTISWYFTFKCQRNDILTELGCNSSWRTCSPPSGTITANFKQNQVDVYLSVITRSETNGSDQTDYITYSISSSVQCSLSVTYQFTETTYRDNAQTEKDEWSQTFNSGDEITRRINVDDGYGNGVRRTSQLTKFTISCDGKVIYEGTTIPEAGKIGVYNIVRKWEEKPHSQKKEKVGSRLLPTFSFNRINRTWW